MVSSNSNWFTQTVENASDKWGKQTNNVLSMTESILCLFSSNPSHDNLEQIDTFLPLFTHSFLIVLFNRWTPSHLASCWYFSLHQSPEFQTAENDSWHDRLSQSCLSWLLFWLLCAISPRLTTSVWSPPLPLDYTFRATEECLWDRRIKP